MGTKLTGQMGAGEEFNFIQDRRGNSQVDALIHTLVTLLIPVYFRPMPVVQHQLPDRTVGSTKIDCCGGTGLFYIRFCTFLILAAGTSAVVAVLMCQASVHECALVNSERDFLTYAVTMLFCLLVVFENRVVPWVLCSFSFLPWKIHV